MTTKRDNKFKISKRRSTEKVPMLFDISTLNSLLGLTYKKSAQVNRRSLANMRDLLNRVDLTQYRTREDFIQRFNAMELILEARLNDGIDNDGILKECCIQGGVEADIVDKLPMYARLNYNDVIGLNKKVEERLKYAYIYPYLDEMKDLITRLESGDYRSPKEIADNYANICKDYINETRKVASLDASNTFSLLDPDFEQKIEEIVELARNPASTLVTGISALNSMLGDGYMGGRIYTYVGLPKFVGHYHVSDNENSFNCWKVS